MRFMMIMIPPEYQPDDSGRQKVGEDFAPDKEAVAEMTKYNEELAKAGVLVSLDGLHPLLTGARVTFKHGRTIVTDGPLAEAKEVIGGYWIIDVKSKDEAVSWAKKCPAVRTNSGAIIEVRQIFEMSEFPDEVRKAAESQTVMNELNKRSGVTEMRQV